MNKTIGILAHVDSGKTTFSEQILYHGKAIRNRGRVDHKDTFLDNHDIERKRGITIFSEQGYFTYNDSNYYLIDTPGHIDFSPEMERSIKIMDYAILLISGVEGVQAHTETGFRLLRENKIPTFIFINKVDREGSNIEKTLKDIRTTLSSNVLLISSDDIRNELNENIIEFVAERDDNLFEKYLDNSYNKELWMSSLKEMINNNKVYPCFYGSALNDIGIEEFLYSLDILTYTNYDSNKNFVGKVFKVKHDESGNRITYIKAIEGRLKTREEVVYKNNDEIIVEKINQIRIYNGNKYQSKNQVSAGQLFGVSGINNALPGDYVFNSDMDNYIRESYELVPTLKSKVIYDTSVNSKEILKCFKILDSEEPALNVVWDESLGEIHVHIMGKIQLEILKEIVNDRFNIDVEFGQCEILYKETIEDSVMGYGHFEPLGHYAEVHLLIEPALRNKNIEFKSEAHVDDLSIGHQNLIKTHIFEKSHRGILGGYELTDLKITLITGRAHNKHTSGGDFREATYRALRQGLENTKNILLEPYYKFKIDAEVDYMGRILSDIQKMKGEFKDPEIIEDKVIISGRGPVATFMDYSMDLISFTKGRGSINYIFDGYDICHNEEEVLENSTYNKDADSEYTSISIFCAKGKGYSVKGNEAKDYMHCQ